MLWTKIVEFLLNVPPWAVVYPYESGILLRGGCWKRTLKEGFYFKWPVYDAVVKVDIAPQVINLPNQSVTTQDGRRVAVSGAIEYSISDAKKAIICVQNYDISLQNAGMGFISHYLNRKSLTECADTSALEKDVLRGLRSKADDWGLCISKFWITDFAEHRVFRLMTHDSPIGFLPPK